MKHLFKAFVITALLVPAVRAGVAGKDTSGKKTGESIYAKIECDRSVTKFRHSYNVSMNQWVGSFKTTPERFHNYKITQCEWKDRGNLTFKVITPGLVMLVIDADNHRKLSTDGWKIIGEADFLFEGASRELVKLAIMEKHLEAGTYEFSSRGQYGTEILTE